MSGRSCCAALAALVALAACGTPAPAPGYADATFTKASMTFESAPPGDPNRPLAADLAVEPVSMLVMFNRFHTSDKLEAALNQKPGQFSRVDLDKDSAPDRLTTAVRDGGDGHYVEVRAKPATGEFVIATLIFDPEWEFLGHYSGLKGGAASTIGRPLPVAGAQPAAPAPVAAPVASSPVATSPASSSPVATAGPGPAPAAGTVTAVPAGSGQAPGVQATP